MGQSWSLKSLKAIFKDEVSESQEQSECILNWLEIKNRI